MKKKILASLTAFTLAACGGEKITVNPPPPPERFLTCAEIPAAPDLSALEAVQATNGALVYPKSETDARDAEIARFIVELRGAYFDCSNQLGRVRDYVEGNQ